MAESLFDEIVRYARFGPDDQEALRTLHPLAKPHFAEISEVFYARILEHEEAANALRSERQVGRLKITLQHWMDRLLAGPWDDEYYELRSRIGRMHVKIKLPQRFMLTAMAVVHCELSDVVERELAKRPTERVRIQTALTKILDIELAIMLESYRDASMALVRRYELMERELLQRRLQISESRYLEIVENAELMIIAMNRDEEVVIFNRKAEELTGYKRAEILGKRCFEMLCHPDSVDRARAAIQAALNGEQPSPFEAKILTLDDDTRVIRWQVTTLAAPEERIACFIGADVTDERELAVRTQRAEHLAALGTLAAGLAHEIRNPLNSAQLQLELMERRLRRTDRPESREKALAAAQLVREEMARLSGLVQDFLAFARPSELRLTGGDLSETVRTVLRLLNPEAEQSNIDVALEAPGPVAAIYDEERIKQVLLNLIRNALEAAGTGGKVRIVVQRSAETATLRIRDNGSGPPDEVDIFAPFSTTKEGGTGLGLPIVHRIITDHGGAISFARHKEDTVFTVRLPLDGPPSTG